MHLIKVFKWWTMWKRKSWLVLKAENVANLQFISTGQSDSDAILKVFLRPFGINLNLLQ